MKTTGQIMSSESSPSSFQPIKKCRVCSDKASGFNFNGLLSCESCKIFYRRNAHRRDKLTCPRGGCNIDLYTRKCCPACRLEKCFKIGMQIDRIRSGTLTEKLSQIVRLHVSSTLNDDNPCCESISTAAAETKDAEITKKKKSNCSTAASTTPQQPFTTLNSYELQLIADIERSMTAHFVDESRLEVVGYAAKISDCFNASAVFIRQVIKLCKSAVGFRRLPVEDQLILLKVFYPAVMTARAAFFYRPDLDGYPVATAEGNKAIFVHFSVFGQYKKKDVASFFRQYVGRLQNELLGDAVLRDLTIMSALYRQRPGLTCRESIRYYERFYSELLRRFLIQKYGGGNEEAAERKFAALLQLVAEIDGIQEAAAELYSDFLPGEADALIDEIFAEKATCTVQGTKKTDK